MLLQVHNELAFEGGPKKKSLPGVVVRISIANVGILFANDVSCQDFDSRTYASPETSWIDTQNANDVQSPLSCENSRGRSGGSGCNHEQSHDFGFIEPEEGCETAAEEREPRGAR
jgi:hypothetical protein